MSTLTTRQKELLSMNWLEVATEEPPNKNICIELSTQVYTEDDIKDGDIEAPYEEERISNLYAALRCLQEYCYTFEGYWFSASLGMDYATGEYTNYAMSIRGLSPLQYEILITFFDTDDAECSDRLEEFVDTLDKHNGVYQPIYQSV